MNIFTSESFQALCLALGLFVFWGLVGIAAALTVKYMLSVIGLRKDIQAMKDKINLLEAQIKDIKQKLS